MLSAVRASRLRLATLTRAFSSDGYGYSYGHVYGPQPQPPPQEEGQNAPEGGAENQGGDGSSFSSDSQDLFDLPKGPTHKEMIAARRHYLKRQARRGLLPPSRPIRKPSF